MMRRIRKGQQAAIDGQGTPLNVTRSRQPEITLDHPLFSSSPTEGGGGGIYHSDNKFFDEIDYGITEKQEFTWRGLIKPSPDSSPLLPLS
jgi:hypothetical protein